MAILHVTSPWKCRYENSSNLELELPSLDSNMGASNKATHGWWKARAWVFNDSTELLLQTFSSGNKPPVVKFSINYSQN